MNMSGKPDILYHDDDLVVVVKPGGLLSVPGRGPDKEDCLAARLKRAFPQMIDQPAVHRLDMFTSGLMVYAVTADAHRHLSCQFAAREVAKEYTALLDGEVALEGGEIHLPFRVDLNDRPRQIYDPIHGKMGTTLWHRLAIENGRTRIRFLPLTGRTHQLRVHAAHPLGLGCPIVGDRLYGRGREGDAMLLHARTLRFRHPTFGELLTFTSEPSF